MILNSENERKIEREYLDFRFKVVEDKLTQLTTLLEENIKKQDKEFESLYNRVNDEMSSINSRLNNHEKMITELKLELKQKYDNCPINSTINELKVLEQETIFTRVTMKNVTRAFITITAVVLLVILSLAALSFDPIIKFLNLIK